MDPEANVREQHRLLENFSAQSGTVQRQRIERITELRAELRGWRAAGGFAPTSSQPGFADFAAAGVHIGRAAADYERDMREAQGD